MKWPSNETRGALASMFTGAVALMSWMALVVTQLVDALKIGA